MAAANYLNRFKFVDMKQQNRFVMEIAPGPHDTQLTIPAYYVRVSGLPNIDNNPVTVDTINSEYKIKGKSRWQNISITLYDPISNDGNDTLSGAKVVWEWLNLYHHDSANDQDGFMDQYKRDIRLIYITPEGEEADQWKLHGAFCASINWGDVDVSSDDLILIELDLSYDWAEYYYKAAPRAKSPSAGGAVDNQRGITGPNGASFVKSVG